MLPIRLLSQSVIAIFDFDFLLFIMLNLVNTLSQIYQVNDNTVDVPIDRIVLNNTGGKGTASLSFEKANRLKLCK